MQAFAHACAESVADEQADRIREGNVVLQLADALAWGGPPLWNRAGVLEAMLAAGAYESAVMALLGPEVCFMLSRGGYGLCLATVVLPGSENEVTAEASTPALALLTALASALLDYDEQYPMSSANLGAPDPARFI